MLPVPLSSLRAVTTSLSVSETRGAGRCLLSACSNSEIIPGFTSGGSEAQAHGKHLACWHTGGKRFTDFSADPSTKGG